MRRGEGSIFFGVVMFVSLGLRLPLAESGPCALLLRLDFLFGLEGLGGVEVLQGVLSNILPLLGIYHREGFRGWHRSRALVSGSLQRHSRKLFRLWRSWLGFELLLLLDCVCGIAPGRRHLLQAVKRCDRHAVGSEICEGDVGRLAVDEMGNLGDDAVRLAHLHFIQLCPALRFDFLNFILEIELYLFFRLFSSFVFSLAKSGEEIFSRIFIKDNPKLVLPVDLFFGHYGRIVTIKAHFASLVEVNQAIIAWSFPSRLIRYLAA